MTRKLQNIYESEGGGAAASLSMLREDGTIKFKTKFRNHSKQQELQAATSVGQRATFAGMKSMCDPGAVRTEEKSSYSESAQEMKKRNAEAKRARRSHGT